MSYDGLKVTGLEKMMERGGMRIACVFGFHDFNRKRICRKCKLAENKVKRKSKYEL